MNNSASAAFEANSAQPHVPKVIMICPTFRKEGPHAQMMSRIAHAIKGWFLSTNNSAHKIIRLIKSSSELQTRAPSLMRFLKN